MVSVRSIFGKRFNVQPSYYEWRSKNNWMKLILTFSDVPSTLRTFIYQISFQNHRVGLVFESLQCRLIIISGSSSININLSPIIEGDILPKRKSISRRFLFEPSIPTFMTKNFVDRYSVSAGGS